MNPMMQVFFIIIINCLGNLVSYGVWKHDYILKNLIFYIFKLFLILILKIILKNIILIFL